jgi:hypothetical protein
MCDVLCSSAHLDIVATNKTKRGMTYILSSTYNTLQMSRLVGTFPKKKTIISTNKLKRVDIHASLITKIKKKL